jgi:uncharacterized protein YjiS (DUF1127 family)
MMLHSKHGRTSKDPEEAMSSMSPDVMVGRPHRVPYWRQVGQGFAEWRHNAHLHHELMTLSDRYLQDIGISSSTADIRPSKPFWPI